MDIENKLKETLQENADENVPEIPIPMRDVLISSFEGEMKKFTLMVWTLALVYGGLAVACIYGFLVTDDVKTMIGLAALAHLFVLFISLVKLWYWMLANRHGTNREIKRLEMRIIELTEKLEKR